MRSLDLVAPKLASNGKNKKIDEHKSGNSGVWNLEGSNKRETSRALVLACMWLAGRCSELIPGSVGEMGWVTMRPRISERMDEWERIPSMRFATVQTLIMNVSDTIHSIALHPVRVGPTRMVTNTHRLEGKIMSRKNHDADNIHHVRERKGRINSRLIGEEPAL